jgi:hypothetical protein
VADNCYFGDSKRDSDSSYTSGASNGANAHAAYVSGYASEPASDYQMLDDDDAQLPF